MSLFSAKKWLSAAEGIKEQDHRQKIAPQTPRSTIELQEMTQSADEKISRSEIPGVGNKVFSPGGKCYTIGEYINDGREGNIFEVEGHPGKVAKIYKEDSCTSWRRDKLKLITRAKLNFSGICFPLETLDNSAGEFTGYIMNEAKGVKLTELFIPKSQFEQNFPECTKLDIVQLSISVLKKIIYLHSRGVILGDISPRNIMFTSPDDVYFIDIDSCQYGPYPCQLGTPGFIAPELRNGQKLSSQMRTEGNENFAVATILFMLMMQGQYPFVNDDRIFPPTGPWRNIWFHLPRQLRGAFMDTFRKDGRHSAESERFSAQKWLELMYAYSRALPSMTDEDPENGKVYPHGSRRA